MSSAAFVFCFQILTLVGVLLTIVKLCRTGLYHRYRMFFVFFLFLVPNTIWPLLIDTSSGAYEYFWAGTEPFAWLFYVLVIFELYRLVLEKHRGLYSLGRWMMYGALAISVFISILSLLPHITPSMPQRSRMLGYYFATARGVYSSMALFILLILLFLSRYPIPLSRNVLVHTGVYSTYFLSGTLGLLLRGLFGLHLDVQVNLFLTGMSSACTLAWFILLTKRGEETRANIPLFGPEYEERALRQLDALNATLLKVSKN